MTTNTDMQAYITGAVRTPIGSFRGSFKNIPAADLAACCIDTSLSNAGIPYRWPVDYCILGNVLQAGLGQAPALQAVRRIKYPVGIPARTVNKMCGSGLDAVILAAEAVTSHSADIVIAGGMESMSNAKYLLDRTNVKKKMGSASQTDLTTDEKTIINDSLILDGLQDAYSGVSMGQCGELCAKQYGFTRVDQDEFAIRSYERAIAAWQSGRFTDEIAIVADENRHSIIQQDEELKKFDPVKLRSMQPIFDPEGGTITAANASKISDGAASMIVISERAKEQYRIRPQARILEYATAVEDPEWFTIAPISAIRKLDFWRSHRDTIDLFEINEAFAPVVLAAMRDLNISESTVNVSGGAIALGHPIGASGARILVTLIHNLITARKKIGVAAICIGGGEAIAMAIEVFEQKVPNKMPRPSYLKR